MVERQCRYAAVTFIEDLPTADALSAQYDIVVDAVFGMESWATSAHFRCVPL